MIGALAAALLLSGCGRKGPLDPPPGGYALPPTGSTDVSRGGTVPTGVRPDYDAEGRPIAPTGAKRRIPADWLLD